VEVIGNAQIVVVRFAVTFVVIGSDLKKMILSMRLNYVKQVVCHTIS
jgi:hypothetical protein